MSRFQLCIMLLVWGTAINAYASGDASWKELTFFHYKPVMFEISNQHIDIHSDAASSMLYRVISIDESASQYLHWSWRVDASSVTPTPLDIAPGDDRLVGLYIFFSKTPDTHDISELKDGNYIAYIWGGSHAVGSVVSSPDKKGRLMIVRAPDEKKKVWHHQSFEYRADFKKLFGYAGYPAFIAMNADTDDTKAATVAAVRNFIFSENPWMNH